jgi:hypothetical protein
MVLVYFLGGLVLENVVLILERGFQRAEVARGFQRAEAARRFQERKSVFEKVLAERLSSVIKETASP